MLAAHRFCTCLIAILSRHRDFLYQDESELFLNLICLCAGSIAHMGPGEGGQEAALPATESARTSRDLAPDASFAAQARGFFFYVLGPLETELRGSQRTNTPCDLSRRCALNNILGLCFRNVRKGGHGDR